MYHIGTFVLLFCDNFKLFIDKFLINEIKNAT